MADDSAIALPNTQAPPAGQATQQQEETADQDVERARVGPLDIDFLLVLFLAVFADALDIILELLGILVVPKIIGIILDILTFGIAFWLRWRVGKIVDAKTHREEMRTQISQRMGQKAGQLTGQSAATRNPLKRFWLKMLGVLFTELLPFVGLLPMWTITVLGSLRQK